VNRLRIPHGRSCARRNWEDEPVAPILIPRRPRAGSAAPVHPGTGPKPSAESPPNGMVPNEAREIVETGT